MLKVIENTGKFSSLCECVRCGGRYEVRSRYDAKKSPVGHLCSGCKNKIIDMKQPDQSSLLSIFNYNPKTGNITHKETTLSGRAGELAIYKQSRGYLCVAIGRKSYLAHRVIFMMQEGRWPHHTDHINHDKADNRWSNLRDVTQADNNRNMPKQANAASGFVGVSLHKPTNRYRAYITADGKSKHLGLFDTVEEAVAARKMASLDYGYHANHGT